MGPVQRAIWYIESHFRLHLALQEIAQAWRYNGKDVTGIPDQWQQFAP